MNLATIKNELGIQVLSLNWDTKEDGSINPDWATGFAPAAKAIVSVPKDVVAVLNTSKNLHLVAMGNVLVKNVPYEKYIIAEHKDVDPARVIGDF